MTLMDLARRAAARIRAGGEKGEKGDKSNTGEPFSPLSPFPPDAAGATPPALTGHERWDARGAQKLMADADALVEHLGVDGRHPAVRDAAGMVFSAHATRDMETVRFAVAEFTVLVRRLAGEKSGAA